MEHKKRRKLLYYPIQYDKRMVMALVRRDVCTPIDTAADAERRFGPGYEFVAGAEPRVYQLH